MVTAQITLLIYGVLLLVGGVIGYTKAKSPKSLLGGLVGSLLSGVSYWLLGSDPRWGLGLGLATAVLLAIVFGLRYRKTRSFMPAGLLLILSIGVAALLGFSFRLA
ncbi:MAG: TMEM14 family protein [Thermostichus sp. DG02_5_bins_236]